MELDDHLRGGLPAVEVDAGRALDDVTRRGRRGRRRRRAVLGGSAAALILLAGAVAFAATRTDDDGGPTRVATDRSTPTTSPPTTDAPASIITVPTDAEPGDDAVWRIDPLHPPSAEDTSFVALVSRQACNSGVTGEVLRPGVRFEAQRVIVEATVVPDLDGGTCPTNDEVPITVDLGQPLGDRVLVDAACLPGGSAETTTWCSTDDGWSPERWQPSPPGAVPLEVPGGPSVAATERADAMEVVASFLADLRAGRWDAAGDRWSGYPYVAGATDRGTVVRELLGSDPVLLGSVWPSVEVVASTGWTEASPIVVVRIGEGAAARSHAFVVGRDDGGPMRIQRLPVPGDAVTELGPGQGAEVDGGQLIVLPAAPVEGGVRVYVDGTEVGGSFDLDSRMVRITVPEGDPGPITVTVATATPELPAAQAWTFVRR